ncbi:NUDIX domain-containing protein [Fictibacillus sp. 26RED30]|uniref:NUDIX domain-containing protein n=1 Tax=Fictibacillus sp. 26RED30 TaxID=2745877 RepID=UPI0018CDA8E2|nr:NUDIX domain-containing protein [Fictibacillus sp. 26RED30]MBH0160188.1 NUDIX domain-containing protein [Fictibacillus sp. 26RED30]
MQFGEKMKDVSYRRREAVYAVVADDNKNIAVMVQNGKGFLPGGGIETGENQIVCLKREIIEETGYTFKMGNFLGNAKQYFRTRQGEHLLNDGYFYTGSFGEYANEPLDQDHELVWMNMDQAEELLFHSSHVWAVKKRLGLV